MRLRIPRQQQLSATPSTRMWRPGHSRICGSMSRPARLLPCNSMDAGRKHTAQLCLPYTSRSCSTPACHRTAILVLRQLFHILFGNSFWAQRAIYAKSMRLGASRDHEHRAVAAIASRFNRVEPSHGQEAFASASTASPQLACRLAAPPGHESGLAPDTNGHE